jgi:hypothetical protein
VLNTLSHLGEMRIHDGWLEEVGRGLAAVAEDQAVAPRSSSASR